MNNIFLGILVLAGIMAVTAYALTSISDVSHTATESGEIDIERKSESMNVLFDGYTIDIQNTAKYDSEIAMFRFYDSSGTEVSRVMIPDSDSRTFGANLPIMNYASLTPDDAYLPSHTLQSFSLVDIGIESLEDITGEVVTKRGRAFPILFEDVLSEEVSSSRDIQQLSESEDVDARDGVGDGTAVLDALGVSLAIHNIITDGTVYFGNGIPGLSTDTRPYVGVDTNDIWAVAVADDDIHETFVVPEFGKEYWNSGGSLHDITSDTQNILGYSTSTNMADSTSISLTNNGIILSGTGIRIIKLYSYSDEILLRGTLSNADVKIVTSPLDLTTLSLSENGYTLAQTTPYQLITSEENHFHVFGCRGGCIPHGYNHIHYTRSMISHLNVVVADESDLQASGHSVLTTSDVTNGISITKQTTFLEDGDSITGTHTITSTHPWNEKYHFAENFEQLTPLPNNSYLVVSLNGGSATIKGENFDPASDVFFKANNLPADTAFDISKNGITGAVGKTTRDGRILLLSGDVDFGIVTSPGGILKIYPESVKYLGNLGAALIDMYHKTSVPLPVGEDLVYIPQNYVRWIFPVSVEVTNVRVDDMPLDYLNGIYAKSDALMIPVIPNADIIYATINGIDTEVLMRDVSVYTQIKQVLEKSSTSSDHSSSGTASTSSNISTSTFLTATHTGTAIANIDVKVGGSAEFTMDSRYTGEFVKYTSCKINYQTERLNKACSTYHVPINPEYIPSIQDLTAAHENEIRNALQNGQLSHITVDVDIIKNMEYVKTVTIHTSSSAQASVIASVHNERYGATNQVRIEYPLTSVTENIAISVDVGDMIEYVIRVNLDVVGAPVPISADGSYSSYVRATTEFGGGVIVVGMS